MYDLLPISVWKKTDVEILNTHCSSRMRSRHLLRTKLHTTVTVPHAGAAHRSIANIHECIDKT